ncbi:MAG: sigma 54-interacting transcriptional regulator, partial [Myxococcota bacterium]
MNAPKLLVVDDGARYVELFHALMRGYRYATRCELPGPCWECTHRPGCALTHAHDWAETEAMLRRHRDLDAVLLDVRFDLPASRLLPAGEGLDLDARQRSEGLRILERIRGMRRDLPVVLMTGESDLDLSERKWLTADEYLSFAGDAAFDVRALSLLIERVARRARAEDDSYVWGETSAMAKLRRDAAALARTSLPVLVLGETGTGKSALARAALHRRGTPFVAVDLSAVPENLMAAELFGTVPGAFSGAVTRAGRFEEASGGTLFLDEVGNLTLAAQRMLLLALQDGAITRLGESRSRPARVKVVAATNAKLERSVAEGMFRADLYARLNPAAALRLPPLR